MALFEVIYADGSKELRHVDATNPKDAAGAIFGSQLDTNPDLKVSVKGPIDPDKPVDKPADKPKPVKGKKDE